MALDIISLKVFTMPVEAEAYRGVGTNAGQLVVSEWQGLLFLTV